MPEPEVATVLLYISVKDGLCPPAVQPRRHPLSSPGCPLVLEDAVATLPAFQTDLVCGPLLCLRSVSSECD